MLEMTITDRSSLAFYKLHSRNFCLQTDVLPNREIIHAAFFYNVGKLYRGHIFAIEFFSTEISSNFFSIDLSHCKWISSIQSSVGAFFASTEKDCVTKIIF